MNEGQQCSAKLRRDAHHTVFSNAELRRTTQRLRQLATLDDACVGDTYPSHEEPA